MKNRWVNNAQMIDQWTITAFRAIFSRCRRRLSPPRSRVRQRAARERPRLDEQARQRLDGRIEKDAAVLMADNERD
ncbi:hypothetical protein [Burkholderia multivorans]|uniref:hypothetical protein n=1 Tax=Burkholderia multivorans TaxID=87883 RepID=UPI0012DFDCBD|nr:hypothetical protein [Burkholderia multivorans]